jgi:hypothetical protein
MSAQPARPGLCVVCATEEREQGQLRCEDCQQQWELAHGPTAPLSCGRQRRAASVRKRPGVDVPVGCHTRQASSISMRRSRASVHTGDTGERPWRANIARTRLLSSAPTS